jgi:isoamylase
MDSLRYWVQEMHVDGFRFDLAATLARELHDVDRLSAFFDIIHQDPVISQVKLIAEPWDVGPGGYQVGNFPVLWAEWNGRYRDTVRAYWRGDPGTMGELGYRLTGSSDLYESDGRRPHASINFVTAHDGFTLNDLVSYNEKHNWANGEENRDGHDHNLSYNFGVEGPTDDPEIVRSGRSRSATSWRRCSSRRACRCSAGRRDGAHAAGQQQRLLPGQRDLLADWELTSGTGSCSSSPGAWRGCGAAHPVFHRRHFFQGRRIRGSELEDITWLRPDGEEMTEEEWNSTSPAASACGSGATRCWSGTSAASA